LQNIRQSILSRGKSELFGKAIPTSALIPEEYCICKRSVLSTSSQKCISTVSDSAMKILLPYRLRVK